MTSRLTRLALGTGISLAGGVLGVLALSSAAHADDGAQRPRGALGAVVDLPEQASATAHDAVDRVAPRPAKPGHAPKPTKDPKPPAGEPTHAPKPPTADEPSDEPAHVPPVVIDLPPAVVDPPPAALEPTPIPTPTLPAQDPPAIPAIPVPTIPVPAVPALTSLPDVVPPLPGLPGLIGPIAAPDTIAPGHADDKPHVAVLAADTIPLCDEPAPTPDRSRDDQHRRTRPPRDTASRQRPAPPCPGEDGTPSPAITTLAGKPQPPTGEQLAADSVAGAYTRPVLHRLTQLRPRGDLPAGRTEHPEPGPA